jgi:hypothetical protein
MHVILAGRHKLPVAPADRVDGTNKIRELEDDSCDTHDSDMCDSTMEARSVHSQTSKYAEMPSVIPSPGSGQGRSRHQVGYEVYLLATRAQEPDAICEQST